MSWLNRYRLRHYIRNAIWILPLLGMVAALVAVATSVRNVGVGLVIATAGFPGTPAPLCAAAVARSGDLAKTWGSRPRASQLFSGSPAFTCSWFRRCSGQ